MSLKNLLLITCCWLLIFSCKEKEVNGTPPPPPGGGEKLTDSVISPNGLLTIIIDVNDKGIDYSVKYAGELIISPSAISMQLRDNITLGDENALVSNVETRVGNDVIDLLYGKTKQLTDHYVEKTLTFTDGYSLVMRAYDEGVAYRFVTALSENIIVNSEGFEVNFTEQPTVWFPQADDKMWSWERSYNFYHTIQNIPKSYFCVTPAMFTYEGLGIRVVVAESDQYDYPGLYLKPAEGSEPRMLGKWANFPKTVSDPNDIYAYHRVLERYDYLARSYGRRTFPWRVFIVSNDDKTLLTNELIYKLAPALKLNKTGWIKPGKSVWEWWHDGILEGINPTGTLSFDSYKLYIDYAAENNIEYLTMDAGWQTSFVKEVCQYAATKNVKVILWDFINMPVENPSRLSEIKSYGAAGIKVDLIERDDQIAMNWIEKLAKDCADHELLLILHGCPKPSGLHRAYPNVITYEAVRGNECAKWDKTPNADYHVQFPFIRMLAGPIDYTPGSMRNVHLDQFTPIPQGIPNSIGTRAHELAMYVIFDQPIAYLCDSPVEYNKHPEVSEFFAAVQATWDETIPLAAEVGEYIVMAKNKDDKWFVGGMTNSEKRTVTVDFSFLPAGLTYNAKIYRDNENTDSDAKAMTVEELTVTSGTVLPVNMQREGGFVINLGQGH